MYGFVDTIEDAKSTSLSIQTVYNNYNLDEILTDDNGSFNTLTVSGRSNIKQRINQIEVPGMHGLLEDNDPTIDVREVIVKYKISDKTNEGFRDRFNRLNALLSGTKQVLKFTDEDAIFYATLSELDVPEEESNNLIGTITFLCTDPHKYGPEKTMSFPADIVTVENKGTAETDPIFEMEATKKTTFAMISNGDDEYNLIGTPVEEDGHEQIVDEKTSVLFEDGRTLDTWNTTGAIVDDYFNDISGTMTSDGAGIRAGTYGTGDKMHGPAIIKELPKSVQDFEIEANFDIISDRLEDNFRTEVYFLDEGMNMLGKIGIKDNSRTQNRRFGLGRVGPYSGKGTRYAIGGHNYLHDNLGNTTLMHMKVKRVRNEFIFYVGRWRNGRHQTVLQNNYRDVANVFQGKLKHIVLFVGNYKDRSSPRRLRINSVQVFEHNRIEVDQTPYILYPGDVVTFDHKDDDILVNGESRMDLKNFGGSFFKLQKGENRLIVTPEDSFNTKVKFRERYL